MIKAHYGTEGGRSKSGVRDPATRIIEDPGGAKETQRVGDTVSPGGQGGAVVMNGQGASKVPED